jgi:hypothetical protein
MRPAKVLRLIDECLSGCVFSKLGLVAPATAVITIGLSMRECLIMGIKPESKQAKLDLMHEL